MLVGTWHTQSTGDSEIMSYLTDKSCDEIEKDVTALLKFDDPPIWSVGKFLVVCPPKSTRSLLSRER